MKKTIVTCDACKEEKECVNMVLSFGGSNYNNKIFDVCKECCIKTNLFDEKFNPQNGYIKTTAEQLFDLLEEIARNANEQ